VQRCPDISRARDLLDWEPRVPLETGLARTIQYFDRLLSNGAESTRVPQGLRNNVPLADLRPQGPNPHDREPPFLPNPPASLALQNPDDVASCRNELRRMRLPNERSRPS
jgi:hypothetical protein